MARCGKPHACGLQELTTFHDVSPRFTSVRRPEEISHECPKLARYRRPMTRSYANPCKEKERSDLAFARRGLGLFLVRQLVQHAQGLKYGPLAYLGAADITVFAIMRNDAATA